VRWKRYGALVQNFLSEASFFKCVFHRGKYVSLIDDADVRRWFDNVSRGSQVTADVYLRRLGSFCHSFGTTPKGLVSLSEGELQKLCSCVLRTLNVTNIMNIVCNENSISLAQNNGVSNDIHSSAF
jgi:hypothetical protein